MQTAQSQLGFDTLLAATDRENETRKQEKLYGHLPGTIDEAVPYFRTLIERHHAAMVAGDAATVMALRKESDQLAIKLNNYEPGILADEDAPGCMLYRLTAAEQGVVPLWGQSGDFEIVHENMRVRIEMDGIFGISSGYLRWLGFAAHAVEWHRPFISETGYRSFVGICGELETGYTPEKFAAEIIAAHILKELKGKLLTIQPQHQPQT